MAKKRLHKLMTLPLLALIWAYRVCISPFTASACRFQPTCSAYAAQAVAQHGVRGVWLAIKRISRCHPWGSHGYDPVPETLRKKTHAAST